MIVGDQFPSAISEFGVEDAWWNQRMFFTALVAVCLDLPLTMLPSLSALKYVSFACIAFLLLFVGVIAYAGIAKPSYDFSTIDASTFFGESVVSWLQTFPILL